MTDELEKTELTPPPVNSGYMIVSPDGKRVPIPQGLFDAFHKFRMERSTGSLQVHFKSGGIAGVDGMQKLIFK